MTINSRVEAAIRKIGIHPLARKMRVSPAYVSRVANGKQPPSDKLLRALGFERTVKVTVVRRRKIAPAEAA